MEFNKPNILVSRCIEFDACRYDGQMIHSEIVRQMKGAVNFVTYCPEMGIGLPAPREAIRLADIDGQRRLIKSMNGDDVSDIMDEYCDDVIRKMKEKHHSKELDGFILKSRSPTCGIKDVKVYKGPGRVQKIATNGIGVFAEKMMEAFGELAFEDEGRLTNFDIREYYLTRIFTHADFRAVRQVHTMKALIDFQSRHKYLFMSYNQSRQKTLGQIVANHEEQPVNDVYVLYEQELNKLLATPPQKRRHVNMLHHIFGYFSDQLNKGEKSYFLDNVDAYLQEQIPLSVVVSILHTWTLRFEQPYLMGQSVFRPFPKELILPMDSKHQK